MWPQIDKLIVRDEKRLLLEDASENKKQLLVAETLLFN